MSLIENEPVGLRILRSATGNTAVTGHEGLLQVERSTLEGFQDIQVVKPGIQFYLGLLRNSEWFAFNKRTHGLWDLLVQLRKIEQQTESRWGVRHGGALGRLLSCVWPTGPFGRRRKLFAERERRYPYKSFWVGGFSDEMIGDLRRAWRYPMIFEGISFRGYSRDGVHTKGIDAGNTKEDLRDAVLHYTPTQPVWHDALVWKDAIITGEFREVIDVIRELRVVVVGPAHLDSLGRLWGLRDFVHVGIHHTNAIGERARILESLTNALKGDNGRRKVCLFQAGVLAFWLTYRLVERGEKSFLIDLGRVLDVWYPDIVGSQPWFQATRTQVISRMGLEDLYR